MRFWKTLAVVLTGTLAGNIGCRKESAPVDASVSSDDAPARSPDAPDPCRDAPAPDVSPQERLVREKLGKTSNWRAYLEAASGNTQIACQIAQDINRIGDPDRRMNCFRLFFETAFSFPVDATDPETRSDQFFAFSEYSESVATCAYHRYDLDNFWETYLRRLRRIKAESQRLREFFSGKGGTDTFKGSRDSWRDYQSYVDGEYGRSKRTASQFGTVQTADFLTFERWLSIRAQLEDILEREVRVWDIVLEKWKKQHRKVPDSAWKLNRPKE